MINLFLSGTADEVMADLKRMAGWPSPLVVPHGAPVVEAPQEPAEPPPGEAPAEAVTNLAEEKRKRRTKAEMEASRAAEAGQMTALVQEIDTVLASAPAPVEATPAPTFDDFKAAGRAVVEADGLGVEAIQRLFKDFGVTKARDVPEARWPEFIAKCNALIEGAKK